MKQFFTIALIALLQTAGLAQDKEQLSAFIDDLNRKIDHAVVRKDVAALKKLYADDFVFTHGTGLVDSKESWIKAIENMGDDRFVSREHDSTVVELHGNVAIVFGKLSVKRQSKKGDREYHLRYVRVFTLADKQWKMISHRTTSEWH